MAWDYIDSYEPDELRSQVSRIARLTRDGDLLGNIPQGAAQVVDGREDDYGRVRYWTVWHQDFPIAAGFFAPPPKAAAQVLSLGVFVLPEWQRQGIYGAVLDLIEQLYGKRAIGDTTQTKEAEAFWQKRTKERLDREDRERRSTTGGADGTHVLGRGITQLLQSLDDVDIRTDYSGRGMYGRSGLALVTDRSPLALFAEILHELNARGAHKDHYEGLVLLMETAREDQLGNRTVVYFPGITAELP